MTDRAEVSFLPFWIAIKKATHTLTAIQMRRASGAGSSAAVTELGSRQLRSGFQQLDIVGAADLVGELFLRDKLASDRFWFLVDHHLNLGAGRDDVNSLRKVNGGFATATRSLRG
jgi:hypothetical protein